MIPYMNILLAKREPETGNSQQTFLPLLPLLPLPPLLPRVFLASVKIELSD